MSSFSIPAPSTVLGFTKLRLSWEYKTCAPWQSAGFILPNFKGRDDRQEANLIKESCGPVTPMDSLPGFCRFNYLQGPGDCRGAFQRWAEVSNTHLLAVQQ